MDLLVARQTSLKYNNKKLLLCYVKQMQYNNYIEVIILEFQLILCTQCGVFLPTELTTGGCQHVFCTESIQVQTYIFTVWVTAQSCRLFGDYFSIYTVYACHGFVLGKTARGHLCRHTIL